MTATTTCEYSSPLATSTCVTITGEATTTAPSYVPDVTAGDILSGFFMLCILVVLFVGTFFKA
jgi:hypothetical protein